MSILATLLIILSSNLLASAEVDRVHVYVQVATPEQLSDTRALATAGADGVAMPVEVLLTTRAVDLITQTHDAGLRCIGVLSLDGPIIGPDGADLLAARPHWLAMDSEGRPMPDRPCLVLPEVQAAFIDMARRVAATGVDGLLVTSLPPLPEGVAFPAREVFCESTLEVYARRYGGDPRDAAGDSFERLLLVKLTGDLTTDFFAELAEVVECPIYLAMRPEDQHPESATGRWLDLYALIARGYIDGVLFAAQTPMDMRRLRLYTDRAITAGLYGLDSPETVAFAALRSRDVDTLMVRAVEGENAVDAIVRVNRAVASFRAQQTQRDAIAKAIEGGELNVVAGAEPEGQLDLATIHGVAQSFVLETPVRVTAVGLFCSLRGPRALSLPDLRVQICGDAGDAPDTAQVLAEGTIPAVTFAEQGGFSWGYALFDPPVELAADRTLWLYCPNAQAGGNSYLWRISKNPKLYPHGHAWSRTYDYREYDWIFRVLANAEGVER